MWEGRQSGRREDRGPGSCGELPPRTWGLCYQLVEGKATAPLAASSQLFYPSPYDDQLVWGNSGFQSLQVVPRSSPYLTAVLWVP